MHAGTGIRPKRREIPLVRGTHLHEIAEQLLTATATREQAREIITAAATKYREDVAAGYATEGTDAAQTAWITDEQAHLVKSLGWLFYRVGMPYITENFDIYAIEREGGIVIGCTCGLTDAVGSREDHEGRDCTGVYAQVRSDLELIRKVDGAHVVMDLKTEAYFDVTQHQHSVQMALQCLAYERMVDQPVNSYYVLSLNPGRRVAARNDTTGLKKQESPLCYVYYKPGSPPMSEDAWSLKYSNARGFSRVPIWEIARTKTDLDPAEWWVNEVMTAEECSELVNISPPMAKPAHLQESFLRQFNSEEQHYANLMWALSETVHVGEINRPAEWPDAEYIAVLDDMNRPSWDCRQWKRNCSYMPICYKEGGWESPLSADRFVIREPHHQPERELFAAQGITFEKQEGGDE